MSEFANNRGNKDSHMREMQDEPLSHVGRVLTVISLLQQGWYTPSELHQLVAPEKQERTIYRDIEEIQHFLREPLVKNHKGEYHFPKTSFPFLHSIEVAVEDGVSLLLLGQVGSGKPGSIPYLNASVPLIEKFSSGLPDEIQKAAEEQVRNVHIHIAPTAPAHSRDFFFQILWARQNCIKISVEYGSVFENTSICTTICPYHIHFNRHAWYVTGYSTFHNEVRTFHLERIQNLKINPNATFVPPFGWSYEKYRGNAWNMIRDEEDVEVELLFSKKVAKNIKSVQWHETEQAHFYSNGTLAYRVTVSGIKEILWWVFGYADEVEVIQPQSLRDEMKRRVRNLAKIYGIGENQNSTFENPD
ncbi:MAG: WYL domain-containing protein [Planctomycetia bacterium]|nr:WYL domain-containing protein [Planctomycetia bacterium]